MRGIVCTLLVVLSVLLLSACDDRTVDPKWTIFEGMVVDSSTGLPIAGAEIYAFDTLPPNEPFLSDSLGRWGWTTPGVGSYVLFCGANGYHTQHRTVVSTYKNSLIDNIIFTLQPE